MEKVAYKIKDINEYRKLMAYCIEKDINVWRAYWSNRKKDNRCYSIDWKTKICYYSSIDYYKSNGYKIIEPNFIFNEYGVVNIENDNSLNINITED